MNSRRKLARLHLFKSASLIFAVLFVSMALTGTVRAVGELDSSFGYKGKVSTDFTHRMDIAYDMVVQPDGKIVLVGLVDLDFTVWYDFGLTRYNSDGSLDLSFGTGGKVSTNFYLFDQAHAVTLQSDGKIVVVGTTEAISGSGATDFAIARYNSNGTLDSTFGNGGKVTLDFFGLADMATAVAIQSDNKIVIGGSVGMDRGGQHDSDFGLARLNSNGSLDTSFDGDGKVATQIPTGIGWTNDGVAALAIDQDGKIVAGGSGVNGGNKFAVARYNSNGSLDSTFDSDGIVFTNAFGPFNADNLRAMAIQADGKILTIGNTTGFYDSTTGIALVRFNTDGSLDTAFGGDGAVFTPRLSGTEMATDVALTAGGKIVVAGYTTDGSLTVLRYLNDGNLDFVFGARGRLFTSTYMGVSPAYAIAIQADGKVLVAGQTTQSNQEISDFMVVRYVANPKSNPIRSDFDGDGRSDIAVFRPSDGVWYVLNSSSGAMSAQPFGANGDVAAPGDYDGDGGRTDYAVFRPSNGTWYVLNSSDSSFRAVQFGANGDVPVPADYDGDAKSDIAVFRPSTGYWYILRSSDNDYQYQSFGVSTDHPVPGYYDGDQKADIAVFRESTGRWYILKSSTNAVEAPAWGTIGDQPVAADYDNDGIFDIAVFRPSTGYWYIVQSHNDYAIYPFLGVAGDIAVPGDFNGDFKADTAMWRPSNGSWYLNPNILPTRFGTSGDVPVLKAYMP